jgi:hypothetical protein
VFRTSLIVSLKRLVIFTTEQFLGCFFINDNPPVNQSFLLFSIHHQHMYYIFCIKIEAKELIAECTHQQASTI